MERQSFIFLREIWRKKDVARTLVNLYFKGKKCGGKILDIGGTKKRASHYRFLEMAPGAEIKTVDINGKNEPNFVLNVEKEKIPADDNTFDFIFLFNLLEHISDPANVLSEALRVLKPGGEVFGCVPFLVNVHPDPHDFIRYTKEKLEDIFKKSGFSGVSVEAAGRGPFTAAFSQIEFLFPKIIKLLLLWPVFFLDALIQKIKPAENFKERFPLSYVFFLKK